jgi:hypothetical protein
MRECGLDICARLSQPISIGLLGNYHQVLVIENAYKEALQADYPESTDWLV